MTTAAFGMIVATGDYKGDLDAIVDVLNSLRLTHGDDDLQWTAFGDETIGVLGCNHEYPTVYPSRYIMVFKDGRRVFAHQADDKLFDKWECENGKMDCERYNLEQLSNLISPLLKKGALELVVTAQEIPMDYGMGIAAYCERLIIRSNGSAERHHYRAAACTRDEYVPKSECYEPKKN